MKNTFDEEAYIEARRRADEQFPLPDATPNTAAFKGVVTSALIVGAAAFLSEYMSLPWAIAVTVTLSGLVAWLDCKSRYEANGRRYREEYDWLVEQKERERALEIERARRRHRDI